MNGARKRENTSRVYPPSTAGLHRWRGKPPEGGWEAGPVTSPRGVSRPKGPMSQVTTRKLVKLAAALRTPRRKVSPMQVAAQLLEEGVARGEWRFGR